MNPNVAKRVILINLVGVHQERTTPFTYSEVLKAVRMYFADAPLEYTPEWVDENVLQPILKTLSEQGLYMVRRKPWEERKKNPPPCGYSHLAMIAREPVSHPPPRILVLPPTRSSVFWSVSRWAAAIIILAGILIYISGCYR